MKKRVLVGMSGGVDSSVAAFLLKEQGYEVIGVTIKLWDEESVESNEKVCCSIEDVYDAKRVCDKIGISHYTVNLKKNFSDKVVDYFLEEYNNGKTPSPCIMCNQFIKFGDLMDYAKKLDCDFISTGHYCKTIKKDNDFYLERGDDPLKDQSYMLYRIINSDLQKVLFPLSNYTKDKVRDIAKKNGIITYKKRDSQGLCFAPYGYIEFLKRNLQDKIKQGEFVDKDGKKIGYHKGYQLYTIGQRRGLELNLGRPYFIIKIIPKKNEIVLGEYKELGTKSVLLNKCIVKEGLIKNGETYTVKPRFSSKGYLAKIFLKENHISVEYEEMNFENAYGQHMVIYDNNIVCGGGIICEEN